MLHKAATLTVDGKCGQPKTEGVRMVERVDFSCQRLSMETPRQTDSERVQELIQKEAHVCGVIHTHIK